MSELPPQIFPARDPNAPPKPPIVKTVTSPAPPVPSPAAPGSYLGAKAIFWLLLAGMFGFFFAPSHVSTIQNVGIIGLGVSLVAAALCSIGWLLKKTRDIVAGRS